MYNIYVTFKDLCTKEKIETLDFKIPAFLHFIDIETLKGKKEAFRLKGSWGARLDPFIKIDNDNKTIKCLYSEEGDVIKQLEKWINLQSKTLKD